MKKIDKTKAELLQELKETKEKVQELDLCLADFEKVKAKYEKLLDSTPDAMLFVNMQNQIVMVNAQFEKIFGYSQEEIIGKGLGILIPDHYKKSHAKMVREFFKQPDIRSMGSHLEIYALKKNGDEFPVDISLSPLQTDEDFLITAAVRDITKRKKAEEQIELNYYIQKVTNSMLKVSLETLSLEEQFDRILDLILNVPHLSLESRGAIFLRDENDRELLKLRSSHGFSESHPVPCNEIPLGKCLCGKAAALTELIFSDHMNSQHEMHDEGVFPHGHYCVPIVSGENVYGLLNVYVKEGHKRSKREEEFLSSVANTLAWIIERKKTQREKRLLQHQLAQAENFAALGRFTANVAHEIRNPLTAVGGFARRLDKNIPDATKEKDYVSFIIAEVNRLEYILKNILTFSRDNAPNIEKKDIHEVIERVLLMNKDLCKEKSITVERSFVEIASIPFDENILIESLENIILNAVDAMPEGGTLSIFTDKVEAAGTSQINIRVQDTGHGIPEEKLGVIFEPFYTTKIAEHGTGLGLSITRKNIESMGGSVDVQSEVGKGTVVTLSFSYDTN
jgi:PAS domain S-box-containing protein